MILMSSDNNPINPYKSLGNKIKKSRILNNMELIEVSEAIEIEVNILKKIESGMLRPDEDILELLITYLNIEDNEADKLWELAGYESESVEEPKEINLTKGIVMMLSPLVNDKASYSDFLDVHYDKSGIVLHFKQVSGQKKPVDVAKVGVSYSQAQEIIRTIQRVLYNKQIIEDNKKD